MNKKFRSFLLIFLLIFSSTSLFAAYGEFYKAVKIQGGYDEVASVKITPIASQTENYMIGMPFPIDDNSVKFGNTEEGRLIATWTVLANFKIKLDIEGEVMHHASESGKALYNHGLGYILNFKYKMSFVDVAGATRIQEGMITLDVPNDGTSIKASKKDIDLLKEQSVGVNNLVGVSEGQVFFQFDQSTTNVLKDEKSYAEYLNGNYLATVTMTIKPFT